MMLIQSQEVCFVAALSCPHTSGLLDGLPLLVDQSCIVLLPDLGVLLWGRDMPPVLKPTTFDHNRQLVVSSNWLILHFENICLVLHVHGKYYYNITLLQFLVYPLFWLRPICHGGCSPVLSARAN